MHVESGIASSGVAFGTFALAPLLRYLVTNEGWKTCNRVLAVICLSCTIFGAMMIPMNKSSSEENEGEDTELLEMKRNNNSFITCILKILKRRSFILLGMSTFTGGMGLIILFTFIPGVDKKSLISATKVNSPNSFQMPN